MVYKNHLVACIKVNGKVLREQFNTVTLPFGCEYSILLKNLNSVRAQVKVSVDGKDATEGTWLIIHPNSSLELERYIRNGNFERGNRFKFIERTGDIEAHRGIGAEDGLVRVEYKAERAVVDQPIIRYYDHWVPRPYIPPIWPRRRRWDDPYYGPYCGAQGGTGSTAQGGQNMAALNCSVQSGEVERSASFSDAGSLGGLNSVSDAGITVAGSESNQKFVPGAWFPTEEHSDVIVLKLRGEVAGKTVEKAVTVDHKPTCSTCGVTNKATSSYCSKCGTALSII
jgi:hypothetical protein